MDLIWLSDYQLFRYVEHLFHREIFCIFDGMHIVWVILHHEYRCSQCWRHKHSHHVTECLSLSFVASFEDWSNIFRTRSFTLCKNDLDFNDKSDSVTVFRVRIIVINIKSVRVLCEQTGWWFICKSLRSCFHHFIRFPLLRRPFFVNIPFWVAWWGSAINGYSCYWMLPIPRAQKY